MDNVKIIETRKNKIIKSKKMNCIFDKENGFTIIWGETFDDDPEYSPFGPLLLDIEISSICSRACEFCYKSNGTYKGKNMLFETFKILFDKFPKETLTQIAFGIGDIDANPDLWKIMEYCRENGVIPNITINGERMTSKYYDKLVGLCGAVAVSLYDKDTCYNAVKELTDRGLKQVNIHSLLAQQTYSQCLEVLSDRETEERLNALNAIVYLWLKPKGINNHFHQVGKGQFENLVNKAIASNTNFGFDSCSAPMFLEITKSRKEYERLKIVVESCESFGIFSGYINVEGAYFPCSFAEGVGEWESGLDVLNCKDFLEDIWFHPLVNKYRRKSIAKTDENGCRKCLIYNLALKEEK